VAARIPARGVRLLDSVVEQMPAGVIVTYADGRLRQVNPAAAWMHGRAVTGIGPMDWTRCYDLLRVDGSTHHPLSSATSGAAPDTIVPWMNRGADARFRGARRPRPLIHPNPASQP
jgi:hypothetical protein